MRDDPWPRRRARADRPPGGIARRRLPRGQRCAAGALDRGSRRRPLGRDEQRRPRRLRRLRRLRRVPCRGCAGLGVVADAQDDARARRRRRARALRRDPLDLQGRRGRARDARRRALRPARVRRRRTSLPRHARHRRPDARGLRRRRGGRLARRGRPAGLLRVRDAVAPLQGLLGHAPRARDAARGPRLEQDLPLLPQHGAGGGPPGGGSGGQGRAAVPGRRGRSRSSRLPSGAASRSPTPGRSPESPLARHSGSGPLRTKGARTGGPSRGASSTSSAIASMAARSVEVSGIGCEACHGGAREHAREPSVRPSFQERAPWLRVDGPTPGRARDVNRACARCHEVLFSKYPFTWEGARPGLHSREAATSPLAKRATSFARRVRRRDGLHRLVTTPTARTPASDSPPSRRPTGNRVSQASRATPATAAPSASSVPTRTTTPRGPAARASRATCRARTWASTAR